MPSTRPDPTWLRPRAKVAIPLAAMACLGGCAAGPGLRCGPGESAHVVAQLAFGRSIGDRASVSDQDFARFADEVLAPAFPSGLTIFDGEGWWRGGDSQVAHEASKLVLVAGPEAGEEARLTAVRRAYMQRFNQNSVLLLKQTACVAG